MDKAIEIVEGLEGVDKLRVKGLIEESIRYHNKNTPLSSSDPMLNEKWDGVQQSILLKVDRLRKTLDAIEHLADWFKPDDDWE